MAILRKKPHMVYDPRKPYRWSMTEDDYEKLTDPKIRSAHKRAVLKSIKKNKVKFIEVKSRPLR